MLSAPSCLCVCSARWVVADRARVPCRVGESLKISASCCTSQSLRAPHGRSSWGWLAFSSGMAAITTLLERVRLVLFAESLGGTESLVTYPLVQTHGSIPGPMLDKLGIDERLLRLSVGLENAEDLIADLEQAIG